MKTFSDDVVTIKISGVNVHPGFAKDKIENAIKIAGKIISRLPDDSMSPETTEGKEGFIHPVSLKAEVDSAVVKFIIRDFETEGLIEKENFLKKSQKKL